jgi:Dolichyl-phosphate-mannose-protein mannosyltransferase
VNAFVRKHHRLLFYTAWLLLGLIQAAFTELQDDEAYYWIYARFLDWGYFDHPPMTALLIRCGTVFFTNELTVRLFPVILNTLTLFITEKLTDRKNPKLFYAICLSMGVLQLTGFMAVPDIPLLFFTAALFYAYRQYLQRPGWMQALLLGLITACLLYSKYHGVLIVLFVLASNPQLFREAKVYAAGLLAFVLFLPHLWWQYQHHWLSFRYHLYESNVNPYKLSHTLDYIGGQLLLAGPLAGIIFLTATFAQKPANTLERALRYTGVGIFLFFLLSTFRGQVEPNWTSPAMVPLIVLSYRWVQQRAAWRKWLLRLTVPTVAIVLIARVAMMVDFLPLPFAVERFHSWEKWPQELKERTHNLPVVVSNNYQRASKYWFYTGQQTYSLNRYDDRRNNFNFWPVEDSMLGRAIYFFDIYNTDSFPAVIQTPLWKLGYAYQPQFYSFARVTIQPERTEYVAVAGDAVTIHFTTAFPQAHRAFLAAHPSVDVPVILGVFQGRNKIRDIACPFTLQQLRTQQITQVSLRPLLPPGNYNLRFSMNSSVGIYSHNSEKIKLKVRP